MYYRFCEHGYLLSTLTVDIHRNFRFKIYDVYMKATYSEIYFAKNILQNLKEAGSSDLFYTSQKVFKTEK